MCQHHSDILSLLVTSTSAYMKKARYRCLVEFVLFDLHECLLNALPVAHADRQKIAVPAMLSGPAIEDAVLDDPGHDAYLD